MSCYYDVNLTVQNLPESELPALLSAMYDPAVDLAYAFDCNAPEKTDDGFIFWGINSLNWGVDIGEMVNLSRKFPDALFILDSKSEFEEMSRDYYQNGRAAYYEPEIVWPEFSFEDLKEVQ